MTRRPCDFIQKRIDSIYAGLSPAKRAELLAAAERLSGNPDVSESCPSSHCIPGTAFISRKGMRYPVVKGKLLVEVADEITQTPRGTVEGNKLFHVQIRCPNMDCQGLFYVPKMRLGRKTACPFCGQHVLVK